MGRPPTWRDPASSAAWRRRSDWYWAEAWFSDEAVAAMDTALDRVRERLRARRLRLVGYSGGGVMTMLLAARRDDVDAVVTLASPLDHAAWTTRRQRSALSRSLSIQSILSRLSGIPQVHVLGGADSLGEVSDQRQISRALPRGLLGAPAEYRPCRIMARRLARD